MSEFFIGVVALLIPAAFYLGICLGAKDEPKTDCEGWRPNS